MEVVVLLKQVPSTESDIAIADSGVSIRTDSVKWIINPYDEFAVEEGLRIREAHGGSVTILSVGPERTVEAIRSALAMGADSGILIQTDAGSPLVTARILARAMVGIPYDLVIAGQRAVDDDSYTVGPAVAELLNIPLISMVTKEEIRDGKIRCHRSLEAGSAVLEAPLPVLFTTQRGLNEPRYASLPGIMKAKKKPLEIKRPEALGIDLDAEGSDPVRLVKLARPSVRKAGKIIEGETAAAKVAELVRALHEDAKLI